mgnify:FL=1
MGRKHSPLRQNWSIRLQRQSDSVSEYTSYDLVIGTTLSGTSLSVRNLLLLVLVVNGLNRALYAAWVVREDYGITSLIRSR